MKFPFNIFFDVGISELNSWCEFIIGVKNTLEKTVDNDDSVIKILSSDEEEDDGTTLVTGVSSNSVAYPGGYIYISKLIGCCYYFAVLNTQDLCLI